MGDDDWGGAARPRHPTSIRLAAYGIVAVLVLGGAAAYGGFVMARPTDLGEGSRHHVTVDPAPGCANPSSIVVGHTVWDSRSISPPEWGGRPVRGVLTIVSVDPDPPHLRHAVFTAEVGGQVEYSGGVGRLSSMPCLVGG